MSRKAQQLGFKSVDVHFGTFDFSMNVIVGPHKNLHKYLQWKFEDEDVPKPRPANSVYAMFYACDGYVPVIWLPRVPRKSRDYAALAHEILHALRYMLVDWAGIPLTRDTDETFCHAMSHAMWQTLEKLK